jgi:cation:H+ antiporter
LEAYFLTLPIYLNVILLGVALYIVLRASHYLVDGSVHVAREFNISPLIIGATVVAMGTSSAELAVNLVVAIGGGDTSTIVGNILGSNLVNLGIELGVSALIVGAITVSQEVFEKDMPLFYAATGLLTALIIDGQIGRTDAILMLSLFVIAIFLIVQYARAKEAKSLLLVETTTMVEISHRSAAELTRRQALEAMVGGLVVLVLGSRLLVLNTTAVAAALNIPEYIIGLVIVGPGTSLPEIASSLQAARRGHAGLVLGTVFGSNLFNLLFGLGLPVLVRPLEINTSALTGFVYMNFINFSLLALLLLDVPILGRVKCINRVIGAYLTAAYLGFISYQVVVDALGHSFIDWLILCGTAAAGTAAVMGAWRFIHRNRRDAALADQDESVSKILCATRGGQSSQRAHQGAIELAQENCAEVLFLYVFDPTSLYEIATPIVINIEEQLRKVRRLLEDTALREAKKSGIYARAVIREGKVVEQIISVAITEVVDTIVLGSPVGSQSVAQMEKLLTMKSELEESTGVQVVIV